MIVALFVLSQVAVAQTLSYDDGQLAGPNDYGGFNHDLRLKEVVRFDATSAMHVDYIDVTVAGAPGTLKLHVWKDIDSTVRPCIPFRGFEFDEVPPIELSVALPDLGQKLTIHLAKTGRRFLLGRGQRVFVGTEVVPEGPRLGCDARNSRPYASVSEVYDAAAPGPERSRIFASAGDFLVRLRGRAVPEPRSPRFRDVTKQMGLPHIEAQAFAWSDVDGDGWEDLLIQGDRLFRNVRGVRFEEVSQRAGIKGEPRAFGLFADYDNDGDVDLFQASRGRQGRDRFLRNDGQGHFIVAPGSPLNEASYACAASWIEATGDGKLDLFVANGTKRGDFGPADGDSMYINQGAGRFTDAAKRFGLSAKSFSSASVAADIDDDGKSELFVGTYRLEPDQLWVFDRSRASDLAPALGLQGGNSLSGAPAFGHALGTNIADLNSDGRLDLIVANLIHPDWRGFEASHESAIYWNEGNRRFRRDTLRSLGISFEESLSDPAIADFDNDGHLDLFHNSWYHSANLYVGLRGQFVDRSAASGIIARQAIASAACDFDRDGRMDLAVGDKAEGFKLFRNVSEQLNWAELRFVGSDCNRGGVGVVAKMKLMSGFVARGLCAGRGMGNQDSPTLHFGLGRLKGQRRCLVRWPCGRQQEVQIPAGRLTTIREPKAPHRSGQHP